MSDEGVKLPSSADEVRAGLELLAQAVTKRTVRGVRRLALLAAGHFDAARTLDTMATTEIGRTMQRDLKASMAGMHDLASRASGLSGDDSPFS